MSENNNFEIGDVVVLKSGGPNMTVSYITEEGEIDVTWLDSSLQVQIERFDFLMLRKVDKA